MPGNSVFIERRRKLMESLPPRSLAVVPPASPKTVSADAKHIEPSRNLYYLTGISQEGTWLVMFRTEGDERNEMLFIEPFDPEYEKWVGRRLTVEEASSKSGVPVVRTDRGWRSAIESAIARHSIRNLFVDFPLSGIGGRQGTRHRLALDLRDAYTHLVHDRLSGPIHLMRMVKDRDEIRTMKRAVEITGQAFRAAAKALEPGMRECEFEAELMRVFIASGAHPAFPVIAAGGPRATCLHYSENGQVLDKGSLLLADFGATFDWYASDITRTLPVGGRFSRRQRHLMDLVIRIQSEAIRLLKPGITLGEWNAAVNDRYAAMLAAAGVIPEAKDLEKVYYHRIGHHLGLDTHDEALPDVPVQAGMVVTVEPGLYIAEEGVGIRIEDDVLVGAKRNTVLSSDIPKTPDDIERLMRSR
ncbi:aminopeptidase P family protein [Candidatus Fermentibacteria bacterium]|nr:aminopeptidase P family protein [Candidatus Fermentibacteria bacterium]